MAEKPKILDALAGRLEFVPFDSGPWIGVPIEGKYLKEVIVPKLNLVCRMSVFSSIEAGQ